MKLVRTTNLGKRNFFLVLFHITLNSIDLIVILKAERNFIIYPLFFS